jgi:hypothetical protein
MGLTNMGKAKVVHLKVSQEQADVIVAAMEAVKETLDRTMPRGKLYQENLYNAQKILTDQIMGKGELN